jgi:hypothetical protein
MRHRSPSTTCEDRSPPGIVIVCYRADRCHSDRRLVIAGPSPDSAAHNLLACAARLRDQCRDAATAAKGETTKMTTSIPEETAKSAPAAAISANSGRFYKHFTILLRPQHTFRWRILSGSTIVIHTVDWPQGGALRYPNNGLKKPANRRSFIKRDARS